MMNAVHLLLSMVMWPLLPVWEKEGWTHVAHLAVLWTIVGHCPLLLSFTSWLPQNLPLVSLTCIDSVVMWHRCFVILVVMWWWSVAVESEWGLWYMVELTQRIKKDDHAEDALQHDHVTCHWNQIWLIKTKTMGWNLCFDQYYRIEPCCYKNTIYGHKSK